MLERVDPNAALHPPARRSGSVLSLPTGDIAGELRPVAIDWRSRRATYELSVDNDTASAIAAFAYPVTPESTDERISWSACTIPPYTSVVVPIEVGLIRRTKAQRVVAELHGPSAHLTIDAALPRSGPDAQRRKTVAALAAAAVVAACFAGYSALQPRVTALSAPVRVAADRPFSVSYGYKGARYAEYTVETAGGLQVRRGTLVRGAGAFTVTVPGGQKAYNLRLIAHGPFDDAAELRRIAVVSGPPALGHGGWPPGLTGVRLKNTFVRGGDEILVAYRAGADGGLVQLLDQQGGVRGEALLDPRLGSTALVAPFVDQVQDFRVVVRAERGGRAKVAAVSLRVGPVAPVFVPQLRPLAPPPGGPRPQQKILTTAPAAALLPYVPIVTVGHPTAARHARSEKTTPPVVTVIQTPAPVHDPIELSSATFASTRPIEVLVLRPERGLHIGLMSTSGDELTGVDVPPHRKSVTLTAPHVERTEQFLIVATYESGNGQETEVRPVTIKVR
jgi:hypothetical protein